jgi:CHAT domain-containing protein
MTDTASRHPEDHVMAAFVDGKLAPDEVAAVAEHLRGCAGCRLVVSETARWEREGYGAARSGAPRWWLAVAAVIALVVAAVSLYQWNDRRRSTPIAQLIAVAPRQHRAVEARVAGFPWARLQAPARGRGAPDPADLKLIGAAGVVLEQTADARTSAEQHARGVAYLLIGSRNEAVAALEQAVIGSNDARVWSDLAAARYAVAVEDERPSLLPLALGAAEHALRLDPRSPEALFNRALILESQGNRAQARKAWQSYLLIDPGGAWSVEARNRLHRLDQHTRRFHPKLLESTPAATLVHQFPMEARTWGEGMVLSDWAEAESKHDAVRAAAKLSTSRAIGAALAMATGEHLLADAVAAIDAADGSARRTLADAHLLYREARLSLKRRDESAAEANFVRAAASFRSGGSAMAEVATYYAAVAAFAQHRGGEVFAALTSLRSRIDRGRHRALAADIERELALAAAAEGDWGAGVRAADAGAAMFRSLGETQNAAVLDGIAANALDMAGGGDAAWARRIRTFAALADTGEDARFLRAAAIVLDRFGRTDAARAMIGLAIDGLDDDPIQRAIALTERARFADREGDLTAARVDLDAARSTAAGVHDRSERETLGASIDLTDATIRRRSEPWAARAELDRVAALFAKGDFRYRLPEVYLERARSNRAAGDDAAAATDYAAAIREIEAQRSTIAHADLRLHFLDTAAEIFDETIELQLSHGATTEAFRVADGARALLDARASTPAFVNAPEVAPHAAVIEYVLLPHAIAVFCLTRKGLTVEKVVIERASLAPRFAAFAEKIRRRAPLDEIRSDAAELHRLLIAPLQSRLDSVDQIVIVPTRQLQAVPFAALYDGVRHQYLVEQFAIRFAAAASSADEGAAAPLQPALVFADPLAPRWPRLPASRAEGERIATLYGATLISGEAATRRRFLSAAKESALIHYAGHADSDAASYGALLLAASDGDSGMLTSSEIARSSLPRHPLVVLAACGTFRGESIHTAGMSSLAQSFLLAGARAVVGTLWEIDDDVAAPLFLAVHEQLRAGASPAQGLRAAQLAMIHASDARLQHPATWAPVEMTEQSLRRTSWTQR